MPPKRQSLATALSTVKDLAPPSSEIVPSKPTAAKPPSRRGKRFIGGYFAPEVAKQLKILSAKTEQSHQDLLVKALNLLFDEYGENPIA